MTMVAIWNFFREGKVERLRTAVNGTVTMTQSGLNKIIKMMSENLFLYFSRVVRVIVNF